MNSFWIIGAIALTVWQAHGLNTQASTMWKKKSAKSISLPYMSYFTIILFSQVFYAINKGQEIDVPLLINGLLQVVFCIVILFSWYNFLPGKISKKDKIILISMAIALVTAIGTLAVVPQEYRYIIFLLIISGGALTAIDQIFQIHQEGRGAIDVWMLFPQCTTNVYWAIYAFTTSHDRAFQIIGPTFSILFALSIIVWFRRQPEEV